VTPRPNIASADVQLPGVRDYEQVDNEIIGTMTPTAGWFGALGLAIACMLIGASSWVYQIYWGLGQAGYAPPVMWGVYIITFVFWVGIGHAGTLISAILYLFRAGFRTTIYRVSEAMTVFAVMTAGLFPIIHIGRPVEVLLAAAVPELAAHLAELQEPARLGRVRDLDLPDDLDDVPLRRPHPRHRGAARPRDQPGPQADLLDPLARLAQLGPRVAALRPRVPVPGGVLHPARALGALGGVVRLRHGADARLARHDLPALLRGRRHLLGLRDGVDHRDPDPQWFRPQALRDAQPARRDGQGGALHLARRRLGVPDRVLHRLVLGRAGRDRVLLQPRVRAVVVERVDPALLQHGAAHVALLAEAAAQHHVAVHPVAVHQPRDVVRALGDRGPVAQPRVRAVAVDALHAELGRHGLPHRLVRLVLHVVPPLPKQLPVFALAEIKEIVPPRMAGGHNGHGPDDQDARRGANFGGPELDGGRGPVLAGGTH
jgi:hypothetical protein